MSADRRPWAGACGRGAMNLSLAQHALPLALSVFVGASGWRSRVASPLGVVLILGDAVSASFTRCFDSPREDLRFAALLWAIAGC